MKALKLTLVSALFLTIFAAPVVRADEIDVDLGRVAQVFGIKLTRETMGSILQYCNPKFERVYRDKRFSPLSFLFYYGNGKTFQLLADRFEEWVAKKESGTTRYYDRAYFYRTVAETLAINKRWPELVSLCQSQNARVSRGALRQLILTMIESENLAILNRFFDPSVKPSAHEKTFNGINVFQPGISVLLRQKEVMQEATYELLDALVRSQRKNQDTALARTALRTFIIFFSNSDKLLFKTA